MTIPVTRRQDFYASAEKRKDFKLKRPISMCRKIWANFLQFGFVEILCLPSTTAFTTVVHEGQHCKQTWYRRDLSPMTV